MKDILKKTVLVEANSFAILILCYSVFDKLGWVWPLSSTVALKFFLITTVIAILIALTMKRLEDTRWLVPVHIAIVLACVFGLGIPLGVLPADAGVALIALGIIVLTYAGSYFAASVIEFKRNVADSEKINAMLNDTRSEEQK